MTGLCDLDDYIMSFIRPRKSSLRLELLDLAYLNNLWDMEQYFPEIEQYHLESFLDDIVEHRVHETVLYYYHHLFNPEDIFMTACANDCKPLVDNYICDMPVDICYRGAWWAHDHGHRRLSVYIFDHAQQFFRIEEVRRRLGVHSN